MYKDPKAYLFDIAEAIDTIFSVHLGEINTFEEYEENLTVQAAVERQLITIGEAAYKLVKEGMELDFGDQVINRRNMLTHRYDSFTSRSIWEAVHYELPGLKVDVDRKIRDK